MIGMMKSKTMDSQASANLIGPYISVQVLIRDGNSDFAVTAQDWPAFCYPGNKCDPVDVEKGLFRGPMLIRVRFCTHCFLFFH